MKKFLVLLALLVMTGCNNNGSDYDEYVEQVLDSEEEQFIVETDTVKMEFHFDQVLDDEYLYRIIIDTPQSDMYNVKAIVVNDAPISDLYPSIGIVDDPVNLIPDVIDKENNYVEGILLAGYLENKFQDVTFKILIEYEDGNGNKQLIYYKYKK